MMVSTLAKRGLRLGAKSLVVTVMATGVLLAAESSANAQMCARGGGGASPGAGGGGGGGFGGGGLGQSGGGGGMAQMMQMAQQAQMRMSMMAQQQQRMMQFQNTVRQQQLVGQQRVPQLANSPTNPQPQMLAQTSFNLRADSRAAARERRRQSILRRRARLRGARDGEGVELLAQSELNPIATP